MAKVSVEDLLKESTNIYEAVAIIAKRSRQINDIQKRQIDSERESMPVVDIRDSEDFEDVEIDREALNREYIKMLIGKSNWPPPINMISGLSFIA